MQRLYMIGDCVNTVIPVIVLEHAACLVPVFSVNKDLLI